jgi:hypothetical protein
LTTRVSHYLAATHHGVLSLRGVALASMRRKLTAERREVWPTIDRVNAALIAIKINDPDELVEAAVALDKAMVELARLARRTVYTRSEWINVRHATIGTHPQRVIEVARQLAAH